MNEIEIKLRSRAKTLLESGEVARVIGWIATRVPGKTRPAVITAPEDAEKLVWNEHCVNSTAKYLMAYRYEDGKSAVCARGCDARAINRLVSDKQLERSKIYILGIPCPGLDNAACSRCGHRNPVVSDELLGQPVAEVKPQGRFSGIEELEKKPLEYRQSFWEDVFTKCIRCYACRNACPACSCRECYADQYRVGWQGKQFNSAENRVYGLTRAYHVGDRCIECGECERVCPMELPIMLQTGKMLRDINDIYGEYECGLSDSEHPALGVYDLGDADEFN